MRLATRIISICSSSSSPENHVELKDQAVVLRFEPGFLGVDDERRTDPGGRRHVDREMKKGGGASEVQPALGRSAQGTWLRRVLSSRGSPEDGA